MADQQSSIGKDRVEQADASDDLLKQRDNSPHPLDKAGASTIAANEAEAQYEPAQTIQSMSTETVRRSRAEAELQHSKDRLAGIIDSAMDAIITIDASADYHALQCRRRENVPLPGC